MIFGDFQCMGEFKTFNIMMIFGDFNVVENFKDFQCCRYSHYLDSSYVVVTTRINFLMWHLFLDWQKDQIHLYI